MNDPALFARQVAAAAVALRRISRDERPLIFTLGGVAGALVSLALYGVYRLATGDTGMDPLLVLFLGAAFGVILGGVVHDIRRSRAFNRISDLDTFAPAATRRARANMREREERDERDCDSEEAARRKKRLRRNGLLG